MIQYNFNNLNFNFKTKISENNYLTHNFHPYPAKFIPKIPRKSIEFFTNIGDIVLDPFCGIGTTLVEAKLLNRNAIGVDIHPVSILASKVKTTKLSLNNIKKINEILLYIENDIRIFYNKTQKLRRKLNLLDFIYKKEFFNEISKIITYKLPSFKGVNHWFQEHVIHELSIIKAYILKISDENLRNFFLCGFSSIIISVSNQESETRYAAINKKIEPMKTFTKFKFKILDMKNRIIRFNDNAFNSKIQVYKQDARELKKLLKENSIDHIITSPPYANVFDYYLYHKQRILWLDEDYEYVKEREIGSRLKFSSKKENPQVFFDNLKICLLDFMYVLKPGKYISIVIGDSIINKKLIKINEEIKKISKDCNLCYIKEFSYLQTEHSRSFNPRFTEENQKKEHIIILQNEQ